MLIFNNLNFPSDASFSHLANLKVASLLYRMYADILYLSREESPREEPRALNLNRGGLTRRS